MTDSRICDLRLTSYIVKINMTVHKPKIHKQSRKVVKGVGPVGMLEVPYRFLPKNLRARKGKIPQRLGNRKTYYPARERTV